MSQRLFLPSKDIRTVSICSLILSSFRKIIVLKLSANALPLTYAVQDDDDEFYDNCPKLPQASKDLVDAEVTALAIRMSKVLEERMEK